jgi:hypothetical protein
MTYSNSNFKIVQTKTFNKYGLGQFFLHFLTKFVR